ncbi:MAG: hypothetical protein RR577_03875 [Erysipelotrichales bacterium]
MKKFIYIFALVLLVVGCNENQVEDKYHQELNRINDVKKYDEDKVADIKVNRSDSDLNDNLYEIIVSDPKVNMKDLQVIAMPIDHKKDEMIPTLNVVDDVDVSTFNSGEVSIKLNLFSEAKYEEFKVALKYGDEYKVYLIKVKDIKI